MSRIGKAPIPVPSGVDISVAERRISWRSRSMSVSARVRLE